MHLNELADFRVKAVQIVHIILNGTVDKSSGICCTVLSPWGELWSSQDGASCPQMCQASTDAPGFTPWGSRGALGVVLSPPPHSTPSPARPVRQTAGVHAVALVGTVLQNLPQLLGSAKVIICMQNFHVCFCIHVSNIFTLVLCRCSMRPYMVNHCPINLSLRYYCKNWRGLSS
jgi:hypothetical protein